MPLPKLKSDKQTYTVAEYLEIDRASEERYEFFDGEILLMAGESDAHGDISVSLIREISSQLKGKGCRVRAKDLKIKSGGFVSAPHLSKKGVFSYPDLVVFCGEPQYDDSFRDILLNPLVIIEVLSDSTERFDRTDKFTRYKMFNPTLSDYILVSQDKPLVEHFIRQDDNSWKIFTYIGLDKDFDISSIGCKLELSEIYDLVTFSEEALEFVAEMSGGRD